MKKFKLLVILTSLVMLISLAAPASASPPDDPSGLQRAIEVKEQHANQLLEVSGVVGVGVGRNGGGNAAIIIFTETRGVRGLPTTLDGVPVITQFSGTFYAEPRGGNGKPPKDNGDPVDPTARQDRPVPIGVSTGHPAITAGTIGARVTDGTNVYALSNNHIYANQNSATIGDAVIQPGTFDGGTSTADDIGTLYDFVEIDFSGGVNYVDAAIALTDIDRMGNSTLSDGYGIPRSTTAVAYVGLKVKKYGRTTGETNGRVYATNGSFNINYGGGNIARFDNQIVVTPGSFSAGGDSGSLIVVNSKRGGHHLEPVGLLFAGSILYTIANPIDLVLDAFGVTIDGN